MSFGARALGVASPGQPGLVACVVELLLGWVMSCAPGPSDPLLPAQPVRTGRAVATVQLDPPGAGPVVVPEIRSRVSEGLGGARLEDALPGGVTSGVGLGGRRRCGHSSWAVLSGSWDPGPAG